MSDVIMDADLVISAELEGMRRLARLDRPKIPVRQEDIPGASCIWNQPSNDGTQRRDGGHRDLVRRHPRPTVPLAATLDAVQNSTLRQRGGHLELRGAAADLDGEAAFLTRLGGREIVTLPRALMARRLGADLDTSDAPDSGLTVSVADTAQELADLRVVVAQSFADASAEEARNGDVEKDFFHAPGVMTYLAVRDRSGDVISTGSILIVNDVANVWSVATAPSARGQGAATAIMRAACREAFDRGASVAALRTTDELARPGGLYQSVGFELVRHERIWEVDDIDDLPRRV